MWIRIEILRFRSSDLTFVSVTTTWCVQVKKSADGSLEMDFHDGFLDRYFRNGGLGVVGKTVSDTWRELDTRYNRKIVLGHNQSCQSEMEFLNGIFSRRFWA